jgi:hypothetical protein
MKHTQYTGVAAKIVLVCLAIMGASQRLLAQSEIHFRLVNNLIVASLKSDQGEAFDFVLDTGADTTVIDPSIAARLAFVSLDTVRQTTLVGVQTVTRGSVASLSAGVVRVEDVRVLVQDLGALRKIDAHIVGIAGQNFLSRFNYLLDYRKRVMRVELVSEIQDAIDGDRVAIDAQENRMLVVSQAEARGAGSLRLLLDSGANCLVLLPRAAQALNLAQQDGGVELTSGGRVATRTGRLGGLTVGGQRLRDLAVALPPVEPGERIGDGMLPTSLFQEIYVNNRDAFVVFNPRDKAGSHLK